MVEAFNDEELADILPDSWVISVNTSGHSIVSNPDFPAQIEAEKSESRWTVGLYVYDGDLEHMNLISNDYSRSFEPSNFDDVKRCVREFIEDLESGSLDEYRVGTADGLSK